jgi:hypothetical protein
VEVVTSVAGVPIRLTGERWSHLVEARDELAGRSDEVLATVENLDWVTKGYGSSLVAWKGYGRKRFLAAIYKELGDADGFIITAYFTRKPSKRNKVWP